MPYFKNWGKYESCLIKNTLDSPHFLWAVQPENMRKRALDADQGRAGAGMSGNKQEQLEKKKNIFSPYKYVQPLHWFL
jgi:hypothetical protein